MLNAINIKGQKVYFMLLSEAGTKKKIVGTGLKEALLNS